MGKQSKHIKRIAMPKTWPLARKGTKYVMKPQAGKSKDLTLPICIIFRDMLKIVKTKKEMKKVLTSKEILVNNKIVESSYFPISLFDIISVPKIKKSFRLEISNNGKLNVNETKEDTQKPYKVIGKKILKKGKIQINLYDGKNFIGTKEIKDVKINDSVVVDLKQNKIAKHIPLKQGAFVWIIKGKHAGEKGTILEMEKGFVTIKAQNRQIKTTIENIYATK